MNSTLTENRRRAEGRYFSDSELTTLENYVNTYAVRLQTYSILSTKSEEMIRQTLAKLAVSDANTVKEHGDNCIRDMTYVLRTVGLTVLKDDNEGFHQEFILWMQNIMCSIRKEAQSARAYRILQDVVRASMPAECAKLINDNLEEFIRALTVRLS